MRRLPNEVLQIFNGIPTSQLLDLAQLSRRDGIIPKALVGPSFCRLNQPPAIGTAAQQSNVADAVVTAKFGGLFVIELNHFVTAGVAVGARAVAIINAPMLIPSEDKLIIGLRQIVWFCLRKTLLCFLFP